MKTNKTYELILCALFAALIAVGSWITLPLPFTPVPVNLAVLFVLLAGALLKPRTAFVAVAVYIALGAFGAPVFNGGTGGFGIITGPTGGYIVGYLFCAVSISIMVNKNKSSNSLFKLAIAMIIALALLYTFGTAWFIHLTGNKLVPSLLACVIPFLPGDGFKIAVACLVSAKARKIFINQGLL